MISPQDDCVCCDCGGADSLRRELRDADAAYDRQRRQLRDVLRMFALVKATAYAEGRNIESWLTDDERAKLGQIYREVEILQLTEAVL